MVILIIFYRHWVTTEMKYRRFTWLSHTAYSLFLYWTLGSSDYHKMNVTWNSAFRLIFQCCWRESVSCLLYYCKVLSMSYITDQWKLLFYEENPHM